MRALKLVAAGASLAAVLAVGFAAQRLAGIGRQVDAATRTFGELPRPRAPSPDDAPARTAPVEMPDDAEAAAARARGRLPVAAEPESPGSSTTLAIQRNDLDYLEQLESYGNDDDMAPLADQDPALESAFDELLNDPDPEVRREARALLDAWMND